jgi:hypothetical protein
LVPTEPSESDKTVLYTVHPSKFSWISFVRSPSLLLSLFNVDKSDDNCYPLISFLSEFQRNEKQFPSSRTEFVQLLVSVFPNQYLRSVYLMELFIADESTFFDTEEFYSFEDVASSEEKSDSSNSVFIVLLHDPFLSDADISGLLTYALSHMISTVRSESPLSKPSNCSVILTEMGMVTPPVAVLLKEILTKKYFNLILSLISSSLRVSSSGLIENLLSCDMFDFIFIDTKLSKMALNHVSQFLALDTQDSSYRDLVSFNYNREENGSSCLMYLLNCIACTLFQIPHNPKGLL